MGAAPWFLLAGGELLLQLWKASARNKSSSLNAAGVLSDLDTARFTDPQGLEKQVSFASSK